MRCPFCTYTHSRAHTHTPCTQKKNPTQKAPGAQAPAGGENRGSTATSSCYWGEGGDGCRRGAAAAAAAAAAAEGGDWRQRVSGACGRGVCSRRASVSSGTRERSRGKEMGPWGFGGRWCAPVQGWRTWAQSPTAHGWGMGIGKRADLLGAFPSHPQPHSDCLTVERSGRVLTGTCPFSCFQDTRCQFPGPVVKT